MILDANKIQAMGYTKDVLDPIDHAEKWKAFGWTTIEVNGHNFQELQNAFSLFGSHSKPLAIIANTIKGKGISFMENKLLWHYRTPQGNEFTTALQELDTCE